MTTSRGTTRPIVRVARFGVWLAMAVVGLALALDVAYFVRGSLEMFPTEERQEQIRVVTAILAAPLALVELGLWWLLRCLPGRGGATRLPR